MSNTKSYFNATRIALIAVFSALAGVLHAFAKFPLPFAFPGFLEFDFSDIPLLIGTFALGPLSGCIIVVVKLLIKLVCVGTANMFAGDLANLLVGIGFAAPAGLFYKYRRTRGGAVAAMGIGSAVSVAVSLLANRFILIPFYVEVMFHGSFAPLIGMMTPLFPGCTEQNFYALYLWVSVLPFNLLRCLVASTVTFFLYKHISRLIDRVCRRLAPKGGTDGRRTAIAVCGALAVVLLLVFFVLVRYFLLGA